MENPWWANPVDTDVRPVVTEERVCFELDVEQRLAYGVAEIKADISGVKGTIVGFNAQQLRVLTVQVDGLSAEYELLDNFQGTADLKLAPDASWACREFVNRWATKARDVELLVNLPPGLHSKPGETLFRIVYVLENPSSGLFFSESSYGQDSRLFAVAHAEIGHAGARVFMPCLNGATELCRWTIEVTVPEGYLAVASGDFCGRYNKDVEVGAQKTTFVYECRVPMCADLIGFAAGHFCFFARDGEMGIEDMDKDTGPQLQICNVSPLGTLESLKRTTHTSGDALSLYQDYFGKRLPYKYYWNVYVPDLPAPLLSCAQMSIMGTRYLLQRSVADTVIESRIVTAFGAARQWFGCVVLGAGPSDNWAPLGVAGFLCEQYVAKAFGKNEARYRMAQAVRIATRLSGGDAQPLGVRAGGGAQSQNHLPHVDPTHDMYKEVKSRAVMQMIGFKIDLNNMHRVLGGILTRAMGCADSSAAEATEGRHLSTAVLLDDILGQTAADLTDMVEHYVYNSSGYRFDVQYDFNETNNASRFSFSQPLGQWYTGSCSVKVHEWDDVKRRDLDILRESMEFEIGCGSRRKISRARRQDGESLDVLDKDLHNQVLDANGTPALWVALNTDLAVLGEFRFRGPEYIYALQIDEDKDVMVQLQAVEELSFHDSLLAINILYRTLICERLFWRVRAAASRALARSAMKRGDRLGMHRLLGFLRERLFDNVKRLFKRNNFTDLAEYFVTEEVLRSLSQVRDPVTRSTPDEIVELVLGLLEQNDNEGNKQDDSFHVANLVQCIGNFSLSGSGDSLFENDVTRRSLDEIGRLLFSRERVLPSFRNVVAISCIDALVAIWLQYPDMADVSALVRLLQPGSFRDVRVCALSALVRLVMMSGRGHVALIRQFHEAFGKADSAALTGGDYRVEFFIWLIDAVNNQVDASLQEAFAHYALFFLTVADSRPEEGDLIPFVSYRSWASLRRSQLLTTPDPSFWPGDVELDQLAGMYLDSFFGIKTNEEIPTVHSCDDGELDCTARACAFSSAEGCRLLAAVHEAVNRRAAPSKGKNRPSLWHHLDWLRRIDAQSKKGESNVLLLDSLWDSMCKHVTRNPAVAAALVKCWAVFAAARGIEDGTGHSLQVSTGLGPDLLISVGPAAPTRKILVTFIASTSLADGMLPSREVNEKLILKT